MPRIALIGILLSVVLMSALFVLNSILPSDYIQVADPGTDTTLPKKIACRNFKSHTDAQIFFDAHGGDNGPYKALDNDHDGSVCESLP